MATLEVCSENGDRQFFELSEDETVLGRDQFCDIVLRRHTVSRQHAHIVRSDGDFYVEDLSSLNGTYLNGRRLEGRTLIKDQDRIHVYEVVTIFHAAAPAVAEQADDDQPVESLESEPLPEDTVERSAATARAAMSSAAAAHDLADKSWQARLRAGVKISLDLEGGLGVDQILPKIIDSLFEIFPQAARGYILLAEAADGHLVPRAIKHRQSEAGHSMTFGPISRKTALHVMLTAEALLMDDGSPDPAAEMSQSVFEHQSLSMICAADGSVAPAARHCLSRYNRPQAALRAGRSRRAGQRGDHRRSGGRDGHGAREPVGRDQRSSDILARPSRCSCSSCRSAGQKWPATSSTTTISRPMKSAATTSATFRWPTGAWR